MSDDIVNLAERRANKSGDCRDWTPLDALRDAIKDIESGKLDVEAIYIAMKTRPQDKDGEPQAGYPWRVAGLHRLTLFGLLQHHLHARLND